MGNYTILSMFENPRRGRKARNFTTNAPKILDLKSPSEQIFSRKLPLGAPEYFTILQYKLHSFNILDDRSMRGLLAKQLKKIQNHLYGQPVLTFAARDVVECLNEH